MHFETNDIFDNYSLHVENPPPALAGSLSARVVESGFRREGSLTALRLIIEISDIGTLNIHGVAGVPISESAVLLSGCSGQRHVLVSRSQNKSNIPHRKEQWNDLVSDVDDGTRS